ncbi:MAG: TetR/AcrR family transcriptional regulator [Jatrophihabitantaceae bacterium]
MTVSPATAATSERRAQLLALAAHLFAERGLRETTVRQIADAAGILSGSLYHHFPSKEAMVDEILTGFLDDLFGAYQQVAGRTDDPRAALEAIIRASFTAIEQHNDAVAIYQREARQLAEQPAFSYIHDRLAEFRALWHRVLADGIADGTFRADLDVDLAYRFLRDTVWVGVGWYRPGGALTIDVVAEQYLSIVLDGIASRRRPVRSKS